MKNSKGVIVPAISNHRLLESAKQYLSRFNYALDKDIHAMALESFFKHVGILDSRQDYDSNLEPTNLIIDDKIDF